MTENMLIDALDYLKSHRGPVSEIPDDQRPGVYAIFATHLDCLAPVDLMPFGIVYVGKTSNLAQRNHFKAEHSGFHSPRRSMGSVLKSSLALRAIPRAAGPSRTNYRNFRFTSDGELRLTKWMASNLEYAIYPNSRDTEALETDLIRQCEPPFNLTKWTNPQKRLIQDLRNLCKAEDEKEWRRTHGN